ncbi:hypothetical protein BHM03_00038354 [Ensete ventricosum]|nr:hypothetical protein BHM03_00038354 [Ensete ventricosum]
MKTIVPSFVMASDLCPDRVRSPEESLVTDLEKNLSSGLVERDQKGPRSSTLVVGFQGQEPKAGGDRFVQNLGSKWGSAFCGLSDLLLRSDEVFLDLVKPLIDLAKLFPHRVGSIVLASSVGKRGVGPAGCKVDGRTWPDEAPPMPKLGKNEELPSSTRREKQELKREFESPSPLPTAETGIVYLWEGSLFVRLALPLSSLGTRRSCTVDVPVQWYVVRA